MITALHFLLLVVLWHFDGATREVPWAWRVEGGSAYVSSVVNFKDVVVFDYQEQNPFVPRVCNDIINFCLSNSCPSLSFFSWPNCSYGWRPTVFSAIDYDAVNSVTPIAIRAKDDGISNSITTRARGYGRGEPIILEMITENGGGIPIDLGIESISGWPIAIGGMGGQPKAGKNGANISAELPCFRIPHSGDLIANLLVRTAQGAPLSNADAAGNCGENSNPDSRISGTTRSAILGGFLFLLGSAAFYAGFQAIDQPRPDRFFRNAAWIGFGFGGLLVGYGTLLMIGAA